MDLAYVGRAHLVLHVKQTMYPGRLLAAQVASMPLHSQYLACAGDMETVLCALVGFQFRHSLPSLVPFRSWAAERWGIL